MLEKLKQALVMVKDLRDKPVPLLDQEEGSAKGECRHQCPILVDYHCLMAFVFYHVSPRHKRSSPTPRCADFVIRVSDLSAQGQNSSTLIIACSDNMPL